MINIAFDYADEQNIKKVIIHGHSGYAKNGKDIVCSSVSTAIYISVGIIGKFTGKYRFESDEKQPLMVLEIEEKSELTNLILDNLLEFLQTLEKQYVKYIKIQINK